MKKVFLAVSGLLCVTMIMIEADLIALEKFDTKQKPFCVGYTIIEADRGINCDGDTVKLVKKFGYYELAQNQKSFRTAFQ